MTPDDATGEYFVGLALGPPHLPTALAIVERRPGSGRPPFAVRRLDRFPDRTSYETIGDAVARIASDEPLSLRASLVDPRTRRVSEVRTRRPSVVVDTTGVGDSVCLPLATRLGAVAAVMRVTITGGRVTTVEARAARVPKIELASTIQAVLQERRLTIPAGLKLREPLERELSTFRPEVRPGRGEDSLEWRETATDDLVFSVALAVWWGSRTVPRVGRLRRLEAAVSRARG